MEKKGVASKHYELKSANNLEPSLSWFADCKSNSRSLFASSRAQELRKARPQVSPRSSALIMSASASATTPPAKRARFSAKMVQKQGPKTDRARDYKAPVQICIYDWGCNAARYFPGQTVAEKLWQLQILHDVHNGVGYQTSTSIDEVLSKFKGGTAKSTKTMEATHAIRYTNTGGKDEKFDRDNVGLVPWRGALYSAGPDVSDALRLLTLVTKRKVECGHLLVHPELQVIGLQEECPFGTLPEGWMYKQATDVPSPFAAAPPKSYRHLVMHVELTEVASPTTNTTKKADYTKTGEDEPVVEDFEQEPDLHEQEASGSWTILMYGGIYDYRREFDMLEIEGGYIDLENDKREFVRTVSTDLGDSGKALLLNILGTRCVQAITCGFAQCHRV